MQREPYKKVVINTDAYTKEMQYIGAFQASLDMHDKVDTMLKRGAITLGALEYIRRRLKRLDK